MILLLPLYFIAAALALGLLGALWMLGVLLYTKVPFVRTPNKAIHVILQNASIKKEDVVYDLGCGDASVLIAIEKATGAKTVGYEISPLAYLRAKMNAKKHQAHTELHFKDFSKVSLHEATVVFCFLIVGVMPKIEKILLNKLKPGTRIICYGYLLPKLNPEKIIPISPTSTSKLYFYTVPS